jgi:hypothetical protein
MGVFNAAAIPVKPLGRCLGPQPVRGDDGEAVEGVTEGLADAFQPVEDPNGGQHMHRVGALAPTGLEQPAGPELGHQGLKEELFRLPGHEPRPELARHGMVEAGIGPLQAQGIRPVHRAAHGVGSLTVCQALSTWHHGRQGKTPLGRGWLPQSRKEMGAHVILVDGPELITHPHREVAARKGSTRDVHRLFGNRWNL